MLGGGTGVEPGKGTPCPKAPCENVLKISPSAPGELTTYNRHYDVMLIGRSRSALVFHKLNGLGRREVVIIVLWAGRQKLNESHWAKSGCWQSYRVPLMRF